ncbi:hypothetical protein FS837_010604 [Tulasnella sp. UAMH 9824]|nr:hypothetical protein FS837_010604 [Tulasnella sp. UAMH 9824]
MVVDRDDWSFIKRKESYYDQISDILAELRFKVGANPSARISLKDFSKTTPSVHKATIAVFRQADRTPKQKLKCSFPFNLPQGAQQLNLIVHATEGGKQIISTHGSVQPAELNGRSVSTSAQEDLAKLAELSPALEKNIDLMVRRPRRSRRYRKVRSSVVRGVSEGGTVSMTIGNHHKSSERSPGAVLTPSGQITGGIAVSVQTTKAPETTGGKRPEKFEINQEEAEVKRDACVSFAFRPG